MSIWLFPLIGASFLTLLTAQATKGNASSFGPPFLSVGDESRQGRRDLREASYGSNLALSIDRANRTRGSRAVRQEQRCFRSQELVEKTCSVYLMQTNQTLTGHFENENDDQPLRETASETRMTFRPTRQERRQERFLEKTIFEPFLSRSATLDWVWYSLRADELGREIARDRSFPRKLDDCAFDVRRGPSARSVFEVEIDRESRPNVSYVRASKLLREWLKANLFLESLDRQPDRTRISESSDSRTNATDFSRFLEFENRGARMSTFDREKPERKTLFFEVRALIDAFEKNQRFLSGRDSLRRVPVELDASRLRRLWIERHKSFFFKVLLKNRLTNESLRAFAKPPRVLSVEKERTTPSSRLRTMPSDTLFLKTFGRRTVSSESKEKKPLTSLLKLHRLRELISNIRPTKKTFPIRTHELLSLKKNDGFWISRKTILDSLADRPETKLGRRGRNREDLAKFLSELSLYRRLSGIELRVSERDIELEPSKDGRRFDRKKTIRYKTPIFRGSCENASIERIGIDRDVATRSVTPFFGKPSLRTKQEALAGNLPQTGVLSTSSFQNVRSSSDVRTTRNVRERSQAIEETSNRPFKGLFSFWIDLREPLSNADFGSRIFEPLKRKTAFDSKLFRIDREDVIVFRKSGDEPTQVRDRGMFKQKVAARTTIGSASGFGHVGADSRLHRREFERIFRTYASVKRPKPSDRSEFSKTFTRLRSLNNLARSEALSTFQRPKAKASKIDFRPIRLILNDMKLVIRSNRRLKKNLERPSYRTLSNRSTNLNSSFQKPKVGSIDDRAKRSERSPVQSGSRSRVLDASVDSKKIMSLTFLKNGDARGNPYDEARFDQKKQSQKKRRLKKLKLENRRRKKRKRFYPRPTSSRFRLYLSFLNSRRPRPSESFESTRVVSRRHRACIFEEKLYGRRNDAWVARTKGTNPSEKRTLETSKFVWQHEPYHHADFYKVSNATLSDFEKLCWKSYWLRSNIKPYIRKIQDNLKRMHEVERSKTARPAFENLTAQMWLAISKNRLATSPSIESFARKGAFAYTNVREGLGNAATSRFSPGRGARATSFEGLEKLVAYEGLVYERILQQIKNIKSQLNVIGETQPRSYKVGRQKFEIAQTPSFVSLSPLTRANLLEPALSNFPFLSVSKDSLVKPFGDLPTLRLLWACQKTNLLTYRENNSAQLLWSTYKNREKLKNNKTRKFLLKLLPGKQTSTRTLATMSQNKTDFARRKIQAFGGSLSHEHDYRGYLRDLRFRIRKNENRARASSEGQTPMNVSIEDSLRSTSKNRAEKTLDTKLQKTSGNFWWSTRPANPIEKTFLALFSIPSTFSEGASVLRAGDRFESLDRVTIVGTFWFCSLIFHLSIFFAFLRIPEVRGLLKFQVLLVSKLSNCYLSALFSIFGMLSKYAKRLNDLVRRIRASVVSNQGFVDRSSSTSADRVPGFGRERKSKSLLVDLRFRGFLGQLEPQVRVSRKASSLSFDPKLSDGSNEASSKPSLVLFSLDPFYRSGLRVQRSRRSPSGLERDSSPQGSVYSFFTGWMWYSFETARPNAATFFARRANVRRSVRSGVRSLAEKKSGSLPAESDRPKPLRQEKGGPGARAVRKDLVSTLGGAPNDRFSSFETGTARFQAIVSLLFLHATKHFARLFYFSIVAFYKVLFATIDCFEALLFLFYKFFEKPAELMVDWIADFFLIEWSSDVTNYVPEAFDREVWKTFVKSVRPVRLFGPLTSGFFVQRLVLNVGESLSSWMLKPDADLLVRQKKGIVFWDVWSEVLILAAEQYKLNLSSLSSVKEDQEFLIENLIRNNVEPEGETSAAHVGRSRFPISVFDPSARTFEKKRFFDSPRWFEALRKLKPVMVFLSTYPANPSMREDLGFRTLRRSNVVDSKFLGFEETRLAIPVFEKARMRQARPPYGEGFGRAPLANASTGPSEGGNEPWERWSINQALTLQGRDTDLFMDVHPAKSFSHVGFLRSSLASQEILGSLVCDLYSGQFGTKTAKNILIVGAPGRGKTSLIQALAGETESKIVIDNARRYTFSSGGVPVGMKLLRDVFDSLSLQTPCLFLLEDIHVIGQRRPLLISDDESSNAKADTFGSDQDELHEKNRAIYQASRHSLSHYRRPYKGDFSRSIATNRFCYELFLGVPTPRQRRSSLTPKSPLPLGAIETNLSGASEERQSGTDALGSSRPTFVSLLQISVDQVFAPPVTSPFNILLLKEQKRLKARKIVKEMPWSGLSYDRSMLITKSSYSVRVKVALLAEASMTNLAMKLDMITDLLVIIDSVRSNRGFVVFATTHVPSSLDPALRRPGRLDETIALPLLPNLISRFEVFKLRFGVGSGPEKRRAASDQTFDLFDYSLSTASRNENEIEDWISRSSLLLLSTRTKVCESSTGSNLYPNFVRDYSIYNPSQAFRCLIDSNGLFREAISRSSRERKASNPTKGDGRSGRRFERALSDFVLASTDALPYLTPAYSKAGEFLVDALVLRNRAGYSTKFFDRSSAAANFGGSERIEDSLFASLYAARFELNDLIVKLFAGKTSEYFVFDGQLRALKTDVRTRAAFFDASRRTNPSEARLFDSVEGSSGHWRGALTFIDALFRKRYLYGKNAIAPSLLRFEDRTDLRSSDSPPNSSILMPAKKFENYQRTFRDFTDKPMATINEKIQAHQQQRFLKLLYGVPVQKTFATVSKNRSVRNVEVPDEGTNGQQSVERRPEILSKTDFRTAFKELSYLDLSALKTSSSSRFYKNRFLVRQRFSFLNQWWNAQLAEHDIETTYLSHVDWRSLFVRSVGDLVIDFPDAEQYYNPKSRRWFLHSGAWSYWFEFEERYRASILEHHVFESFATTIGLLDRNRETLDYLAFSFLRYHQLKEIDFVHALLRFHRT